MPVESPNPPLTIDGLQQTIRDRYYATDNARGTSSTFMWFIEEVGELATALQRAHSEGAQQNLDEEFADVLAWLCTLANISDVDLAAAVHRKYLAGNGPEGRK